MIHSIFLLLVPIILSSNILSNEIEKYDPMVDSFLYIDQNQKNLPSDIFIMNLKEVITREDPLYNNIKKGIRKYEDTKISINELQYKFDNGSEAEGGKKIIESINCILKSFKENRDASQYFVDYFEKGHREIHSVLTSNISCSKINDSVNHLDIRKR